MSLDDAEVDIIAIDSDDDDEEIKGSTYSHDDHDMMPESSEAEGLVSARTDGIRGKRYQDYDFQLSSGTESGELTDSDVDIVGISENKENEFSSKPKSIRGEDSLHNDEIANKDVICKDAVLDESNSGQEESTFNSIRLQTQSTSVLWKPADIDVHVRTNEDMKGILRCINTEPFDYESIDGAKKLLSDYRQIMPVIAVSSDDEDHYFEISDSESGDDSDYNIPLSVTSEVNKMANMNIKDHPFKETFPEVEIIDLTLSECEQINPLGKIFKIVEDFVVVNSCNCDKVLDLDSMIFNESRKCVGYVFEVLGPVKEPYYSIHFNTNSDILNFGLQLNQELFYSPNERYSRYVMVDLLRELEYNNRFRRNSDGDQSNCSDSGNSESETEEIKEIVKRPTVGTKRKPKKQMQNRTTSNYSVNYQSVHKQPKHHYNSFVDQLKTVSYANPVPSFSQRTLSDQWRQVPKPTQSIGAEKKNDAESTSYDSLYDKVKSDQKRQTPSQTQVNSFKSSVLASFLDPFSLDEPND